MSTFDAETRQPGSVFAWGDDEYNQLGFEGSEQTFTKVDGRKFLAEPVLNDEFEGLGIVQVAAGQRHSLALDEFGNVWSCGRGSEGQLGLGDRIGRGKPTRVGAALDNYRCVAVACGPDCSAVITQDGHLYEWGLMHYVPETPGSVAAAAASAAGGTSNPSVAMPGLASARPVSKRLQKLLRDSTMKYLSAKPTTKLASLPEGVTMNDYVYESSDSEDDERRDTSQDTEQQRERARRKAETEEAGVKSVRTRRHPACWPVLCKELSGIRLVSIAFGYGSVLVLSENGDVYSKGFNDRGQLGIGSRLNQVTFQKVDFSASQILTEDEYMLEALEADDGGGVSGLPPAVEGEGENVRRSSSQSTSSSVSHFSTHMVKLACGSTHCMCLSVDGAVFVWGSNVFGQLGMGEGHSDFVRPVLNRALNAIAGPISDVACGSHHSSAINSDGVLFSWGHSEYGQHGAGVSGGHDLRYGAYLKYYHTPRRIPPFDSANGPRLVSISCVDLFTVALDTHGRPWSWGWDTHGALGHGRALIRQHPQIIAKLDGIEVAQVAAGYKHVIALTKPEGFRFALRFRPLFLQSLHGAPSWVVDLGEHHDILIVSNHRSWTPASESSSGTKKPKARRAPVKGHRYIIFARCPPLRVLYDDAVADQSMAKLKLKDDASNGDEKEQLVEICLPGPHEPLVVQALVEYLYTDQVRGCPPHRFNDLANLANQLGLTRLTSLCAKLQHARKLQAGLDGLLSRPRIASVAQLAASVAQNTSVGGIAAAASLANQELSATDNSVSEAEIVEEETQEKEVEQPKLAASTFSQDMEQAVNNDEFSDVMFSLEDDDAIIGTDIEEEESAGTLQPLGKKRPPIAVHRTILARFPFFNRLLNSGFAESIKMQSGEAVPLTGVSYDTFYAMLHWLYTGNTKVVDETNVLEILAGARCFGMDVLASHCENFVLDRIDVENAPELLSFAESINAPRLLGECKAKLEQNQKPIVDK